MPTELDIAAAREGYPAALRQLLAVQQERDTWKANYLEVVEGEPAKVQQKLMDKAVDDCRVLRERLETVERERDEARAVEYVAWCRYVIEHDKPTRIVLCDSDEPGAFKVYRSPRMDELDGKIRAAFTKYDGVGK